MKLNDIINQMDLTECPNKGEYTVFSAAQKNFSKNDYILRYGAGNWTATYRRSKLNPYTLPCIKLNSRYRKDRNIRLDTWTW